MTNIFVLWVTILSGPMDGASYGIIHYTEASCLNAKTAISDTLDYDHNLECEAMPVEVDEE